MDCGVNGVQMEATEDTLKGIYGTRVTRFFWSPYFPWRDIKKQQVSRKSRLALRIFMSMKSIVLGS